MVTGKIKKSTKHPQTTRTTQSTRSARVVARDPELTVATPVQKPIFSQLVDSKFNSVSVSDDLLKQLGIGTQLQDVLYADSQEIQSVRFSFMSDQEVENYAVCEITDPKIAVAPNTVYDPLMGPGGPGTTVDICRTCKSNWKDCPGHFGFIRLAVRIPHPMRSKSILNYLKVCCINCCRLAITKDFL